MNTYHSIFVALRDEAIHAKKYNDKFLMCRRLHELCMQSKVHNWPKAEDYLFDLLMKTEIKEKRTYNSTAWYPIEDYDSRILNIDRAMEMMKIPMPVMSYSKVFNNRKQ